MALKVGSKCLPLGREQWYTAGRKKCSYACYRARVFERFHVLRVLMQATYPPQLPNLIQTVVPSPAPTVTKLLLQGDANSADADKEQRVEVFQQRRTSNTKDII